jgi:hypothetical protein
MPCLVLEVVLLPMDKCMTTITLTLPEQTMKRAQEAAAALQRPVEELLSDMLSAVLPTTHDTPADMQAELTRMTWLDSQELWRIAQGQMSAEAQERLQELTHLQAQRPLGPEEQTQLDVLRQDYGRMTLLKARAYALLSLRGGEPLLNRI